MSVAQNPAAIELRDLTAADQDEVCRIDRLETGVDKPAYWRRVFTSFLDAGEGEPRIGLAAEVGGRIAGFLFGEVRAFEFGSEPCGWIFAVGVDPGRRRAGIASALLDGAGRRFAASGLAKVRTMVKRNDVPLLSFFRSRGFVGGRFVQLELDLEDGS